VSPPYIGEHLPALHGAERLRDREDWEPLLLFQLKVVGREGRRGGLKKDDSIKTLSVFLYM
jgi:hypothetical protein